MNARDFASKHIEGSASRTFRFKAAPQTIQEVLEGPHLKRLIGDQGFSFVEAAAAEAHMRRRRAEREASRS